jgi:general secretion pathway protein F
MTLEQLIALNDEIASLARANVPLEAALSRLGEDLPGRLGKITQMLALRMERGESLAEILEKEPEHFPPVYRAVVLAGLRAGRLPSALESVSHAARRLAETRRMTASGFLYPLLVVLVAWFLFVFFISRVTPVLLDFLGDFEGPGHGLLVVLSGWAESAWILGPAVPAAIVLLAAIWWFRSARATLLQPSPSLLLLGWLPWLGRMLRSYRVVMFAEVLALLLENRVPLPESVVLAAEAAGDRRMIRAAKDIADALTRGQSLQYGGVLRREFPPLLNWLMLTGESRGALLPALRHASDMYRRQARRHADLARVFVPVLLTIAVGGTVTLIYALLLFAPWARLLAAMSGM